MRTDAFFSECRRFRFWLLREWDATLPKVAFIGLNPSTADETVNDPTIRRCMGFARTWGKGGLLMLNLYAYRATKPRDLWRARESGTDIPGGQRNRLGSQFAYTKEFGCDLVIAAWGTHGLRRQLYLKEAWSQWPGLMCLGLNTDGTPKHPLYLKGDACPVPFT